MFGVLLLTIAVFAVAMTVMAVGVIFSGRCLRGSCGGAEVLGPDGNPLSCSTCPKRKKNREDGDAEEVDPLASIGIRMEG